jgi:hypothetical protein
VLTDVRPYVPGHTGVMGHLFLPDTWIACNALKARYAFSFCSFHSPSTSASDAEKRVVVDHAVARSVSAVHRLAPDNSAVRPRQCIFVVSSVG